MFLLVIVVLILAIYFFTTKNHNYWARKKIRHDPPIPLFGNHFRNAFSVKSIVEITDELYKKYSDEKVVGYYKGRTPLLIVRDLDIAKKILNTDFAYFHPRGLGRNPDLEPLFMNVFHVDGDRWKLARKRLTSAFSTAKLKNMFPLIIDCAEKLHAAGDNIVANGGEFDAREVMARFTTEFIGACGFGIEMDTINNENSLFRDLGKKMFNRSSVDLIVTPLIDLFPELRSFIFNPADEIRNKITQIFTNIRDQRGGKPSGRNDFIDLLLELKTKGKIYGESVEKYNYDGTPILVDLEMDLNFMIAQVFVFFGARFETSSFASSFTLHQLAFHPEIQRVIQREVDEVLLKYNNKLSYEAISQMNLLRMAFREAMRMFPCSGALHRVCAKKYTFDDLGIAIDAGVKIIIPIQAIQNDQKYFDKPSEFRPERFSNNAAEFHKYAYLPFGEGPRACIGGRLGEMQSLAGLAAVLQRFTVEPAPSTKRIPKVNPLMNVVQGIIGGLPLRLSFRKENK